MLIIISNTCLFCTATFTFISTGVQAGERGCSPPPPPQFQGVLNFSRPCEPKQCTFYCDKMFWSSTSCVMASTHRALKFQDGNNQQLWKLEAKFSIHVVLRHQLCPLPRGWYYVVEKDQRPTAPRSGKQWQNRTTQLMPNWSSKSQLSQADARSNCQLLPHYFMQYPGEELNLSRVHLSN